MLISSLVCNFLDMFLFMNWFFFKCSILETLQFCYFAFFYYFEWNDLILYHLIINESMLLLKG